MQKKFKFGIKQKVWTIRQSEVAEKCPICKGSGQVKIEGQFFRCPNCDGDKYIRKKYPEWIISIDYKREIKEIKIKIDKEIIYSVDYNDYYEKDCFATRAEAQKECDRRNGKI